MCVCWFCLCVIGRGGGGGGGGAKPHVVLPLLSAHYTGLATRRHKYTQLPALNIHPVLYYICIYFYFYVSRFGASDMAIECMHNQYLCNRQISVQYAYKKDSKGERHGGQVSQSVSRERFFRGLLVESDFFREQSESAGPGRVFGKCHGPGWAVVHHITLRDRSQLYLSLFSLFVVAVAVVAVVVFLVAVIAVVVSGRHRRLPCQRNKEW